MRIYRHAALSFLSISINPIHALVLPAGPDKYGSALQRNKRDINGSSTPAPIVVSASQKWEGNDGLWSTFEVQIGNAQSVRLLPSTTTSLIWVMTNRNDCVNGTSVSCADSHGGFYDQKVSNTWEPLANNSIIVDTFSEGNLQAGLGLDNVKLNSSNFGTVSVQKSIIASVDGPSFTWLGALGLNPRLVNVSRTKDSAQDGIIAKMKDQKLIPSLSWAYTAGAGYWMGGFYGSLVLGGYDSTRLIKPAATDPQLTFPMNTDPDRSLLVGISSIKASSTISSTSATELLSQGSGISATIDSTTPFLRLPESACKSFEAAFGLTWNSQTGLYILNASQHQTLLTLDPSITFTLSPTLPASTPNKTVPITLPYSAFDLSLTSTSQKQESLYFPLKRAMNESQISLGRSFLQEAYLIADYERNNFSIWPINWSWTQEKSQVVTISSSNSTNAIPLEGMKHFLSKTAIAGISTGTSIFAFVSVLALTLFTRRQNRKNSSIKELSANSDHELHGEHRFESPGGGKFELDGIGRPFEADSRPFAFEMDAGYEGVEMASAATTAKVSEESALEADATSDYGTGGRDSSSATKIEGNNNEQKDRNSQSEHKGGSKGIMSFSDFFKTAQRPQNR